MSIKNFINTSLDNIPYEACLPILEELKQQSIILKLPSMLIGFLADCVSCYPDHRHELRFNIFSHFLEHSDLRSSKSVTDQIVGDPETPDYLIRTVCLRISYRLLNDGDIAGLKLYLPVLFTKLPTFDVASMLTILWMKKHAAPNLDSREETDVFFRAIEFLREEKPEIVASHFADIKIASSDEIEASAVHRISSRKRRRIKPKTLNFEHYAFKRFDSETRAPDVFIYRLDYGAIRFIDGCICVINKEQKIIGSPSSRIIKKEECTINTHHLGGVSALIADHFLSNNYCHWIYDILPRIQWIRGFLGNSVDHWIVKNVNLPFHQETLNLLGINQSKLVSLEEHPHVICDDLICLSDTGARCLHPAHHASPQVLIPLKESLLHTIPIKESNQPVKLFISREDCTNRTIAGEDLLCKLLCERYGFTKVVPSRLSVREQVDLFQRATHVIGCHGAGLTNILFCNPGTIVIEILNICYATPAYALIAQELGLNYQYVCGAPDDVELSEEIAAKQNHRPDLGNQNFHILPTTVEKICEFLDRPSKDNITEKEKVMPTPDKPLRKSVEMLRSTIAGCRTDVVIGILDDANQVILSTLCLLALDPSLPKFEIYPVNSTITDLLPSPLNQMTTALSLLNTDSKYEISVVIGPKLSVAKIREFAPPSARFAANCAALVWDKDFNPFNDVITKRRLSDLCPLTTPLSSRSLPYEAHISAHIKANGDYVSFYKDKTVQQVPSAIPFLIDLANKEKCTTIIEIGTGNGGLSQAFADYTRSKIVTLDIENKAQHLINYSDRVTYLVTDAHQDSTVDLLSSLRNDGKLLLLIDGGDKSREFNHLKGLLQEDDLIMVHDFAPTKDDFEEVKRSKTWLWHESSEDCLDLQGLQKYPGYSLIWKHFVWGAFYKA